VGRSSTIATVALTGDDGVGVHLLDQTTPYGTWRRGRTIQSVEEIERQRPAWHRTKPDDHVRPAFGQPSDLTSIRSVCRRRAQ